MIINKWSANHLNSTDILFLGVEVESEFNYFNDDMAVIIKRCYEEYQGDWRVLLYREVGFR